NYPGDLEVNPDKLSVAKAMEKHFNGRGVQVFVAGFELGDEEAEARRQFGVFTRLDPPGKFFTANTKRELIEAFRKATARQPLHPRAHEPGSRKAIALTRDRQPDLALTRVQDNLNPSRTLQPGTYRATVPLLPPQRIQVRDGDVLVLQATRKGL